MMNNIYLDYAAATPTSEDVQKAMLPFYSQSFYNPSATYLSATEVKKRLEKARADVALALGCRPAELVFTAGGTEANNLALKGVVDAYDDAHVVTTALEHDSVRAPLEYLKSKNTSYTEVLPEQNGIVAVDAVVQAITDKTVLVSVMYANNEIGTIQPIKEIARALSAIRTDRHERGVDRPLYFHTDACQAPNYLDVHVSRLGVDLMTLNGGKIYGTKQSGVLYVASHVVMAPLIHGGGQERGFRSGTENVAAAVGFSVALSQAQAMRKDEGERLAGLQRLFIEQLAQQVPQAVLNGSVKHRLPNNVHITIPNTDNERLIFALDDMGILAAAGSACSASKDEPSHVLAALGLSEAEAQSSLRFTFGRSTNEAEILATIQAITKHLA